MAAPKSIRRGRFLALKVTIAILIADLPLPAIYPRPRKMQIFSHHGFG
jgi:hypothetical protein